MTRVNIYQMASYFLYLEQNILCVKGSYKLQFHPYILVTQVWKFCGTPSDQNKKSSQMWKVIFKGSLNILPSSCESYKVFFIQTIFAQFFIPRVNNPVFHYILHNCTLYNEEISLLYYCYSFYKTNHNICLKINQSCISILQT